MIDFANLNSINDDNNVTNNNRDEDFHFEVGDFHLAFNIEIVGDGNPEIVQISISVLVLQPFFSLALYRYMFISSRYMQMNEDISLSSIVTLTLIPNNNPDALLLFTVYYFAF